MKSKWQLISSIFQIIVGILAIISFVIIVSSGEDATKWMVAVILSAVMLVLGIIGIIDYKSNK